MGLVGALCSLLKGYGLLFGAWSTFKVLRGEGGRYDAVAGERMLRFWAVLSSVFTYDAYLEWMLSFWCPFYYELKFGALLWLMMPGSDAPQYLFTRVLHPAMAVAAFHLRRDVIPRISGAVLAAARWVHSRTLPPLSRAVTSGELKMWDRAVRGQMAAVQMELELRRIAGKHIADTRLPDPAAAALAANRSSTAADLLREFMEPTASASANAGISGAYKVSKAAGERRAAGTVQEQKATLRGVRFAEADEEPAAFVPPIAVMAESPTSPAGWLKSDVSMEGAVTEEGGYAGVPSGDSPRDSPKTDGRASNVSTRRRRAA